MEWLHLWTLCFLCVSRWPGSQAKTDVYIYSNLYRNPQVTSSTLTWENVDPKRLMHWPKHMVEAAVAGDQEVYICMKEQAGLNVPGTLKKPNCTVSLYGKITHPDRFNVLVNQEGAALLKWEPIKVGIYQKNGAVSTGKQFYIARVVEEDGSYLAGKFDSTEQKIIVEKNGKEERHQDGEILVEVLPSHYSLDDIRLIQRGATVSEEEVLLQEMTLTNPDPQPKIMSEKVTVNVEEQESWVLGTGTYWDTPRSIDFNNRVLNLKNDVRHKETKTLSKVMDFHLPPESEVQIKLMGRRTLSRMQYTGSLTTDFPEFQKIRKISGVHENTKILEIKAKYNGYNPEKQDVEPIYRYFLGPYVSTTTTRTTTTEQATTQKQPTIVRVTESELPAASNPPHASTMPPPESTSYVPPPWVRGEHTSDASVDSRQHDKPEAQEVIDSPGKDSSATMVHSAPFLLCLLFLLVVIR